MATIPMTRRLQDDRHSSAAARALAVLDEMFAYADPADQVPQVQDDPVDYDLVA